MSDLEYIHYEQGVAEFDRGNFGESIAHYRKAIELQPDDPYLHYNLALALDGIGDGQGAGVTYREAIRLNPADERLHYGMGAHFLKMRQWDQAIASFRLTVDLKPGWTDALHAMVVALQRKAEDSRQINDYAAYLEDNERLLSLYPENLVRREGRAWALWKTGRRSEALTEAAALLSAEPTSRNYSRVFHYQRSLGRWHDLWRTTAAMFQYELQKSVRKFAWEEAKAKEMKAEETKKT